MNNNSRAMLLPLVSVISMATMLAFAVSSSENAEASLEEAESPAALKPEDVIKMDDNRLKAFAQELMSGDVGPPSSKNGGESRDGASANAEAPALSQEKHAKGAESAEKMDGTQKNTFGQELIAGDTGANSGAGGNAGTTVGAGSASDAVKGKESVEGVFNNAYFMGGSAGNVDFPNAGYDASTCWYRCASKGIQYCGTVRSEFLRKACLHASGKGCNMYCGNQMNQRW